MDSIGAMGFWPSIITLVGTLVTGGGIGVGFKAWLEHKRGTRQDSDNVAMGLVGKLQARVDTLEARDTEREEAARTRDALCEANIGILRHRINNLSSEIDALLLLIEMAPEKASEIVQRIKEMRARHELAEATEKATVQAAVITAGKPA